MMENKTNKNGSASSCKNFSENKGQNQNSKKEYTNKTGANGASSSTNSQNCGNN